MILCLCMHTPERVGSTLSLADNDFSSDSVLNVHVMLCEKRFALLLQNTNEAIG